MVSEAMTTVENIENIENIEAEAEAKPKNRKPEPENVVRIADATPMRLKFSKTGDLQYISHLDLNRTMQRIMLRAGVPIWYSEGFNPKPKLVFAVPLSVGCESVCEYVDIKLNKPVSSVEILDSLNKNSTGELIFTDAYAPTQKFAAVGYAGYKLSITSANVTPALADDANALFASPVVLPKRTKSGEKDTDITPFINRISFAYSDGSLVAEMRLAASDASYLNPEYVVTALKNRFGILSGNVTEEYYSLMRTELYLADGETPFR